MGKFQQPIAVVLLLSILASSGIGLEDQQYRGVKQFELAAVYDEKFIEGVESVVTVTKEMENIVDVLPESDLTTTCKTILKSSAIIGNFLCFGYGGLVPQNDEAVKKLDKITELLVEKFNEISNQIKKATQEIKAFIEENTFKTEVAFLVNQLMGHINLFYTNRNQDMKHKLKNTCQKITVESVFMNMKSLLDTHAIANQLKFEEYSDEAFNRIETLYKNMMKQLLFAFPICQNLVYGGSENGTEFEKRSEHIVKFIAEIEEKLKIENDKRNRILEDIRSSSYALERLKSRVNHYKNLPTRGWEVKTLYGKAQCGEQFAILITRNVWLYVKLFTEKEDSLCGRESGSNKPWFIRKKCWTSSGAKDVADEWKALLENGDYYELDHD